ncbi:hypothetical protein E2C01_053848 [Portunus trituberculatus]|uniref:Uncharacterized protein n=1 Tax=Portunus trituberculatus TaxID=210409 RepID=A0A5B7GHS5_PORTR|nr:hypothetical protein [Portunus trituberculatus]
MCYVTCATSRRFHRNCYGVEVKVTTARTHPTAAHVAAPTPHVADVAAMSLQKSLPPPLHYLHQPRRHLPLKSRLPQDRLPGNNLRLSHAPGTGMPDAHGFIFTPA